MHTSTNKIAKLLGITSILFSFNCLAEKWVHIDNDVYIDTDNKIVQGDLIKVHLKTSNSSGWLTFDCKRKLLFTDKGSTTPSDKLLTAVCKKPWEIWK